MADGLTTSRESPIQRNLEALNAFAISKKSPDSPEPSPANS
jgi:hypothetical protein